MAKVLFIILVLSVVLYYLLHDLVISPEQIKQHIKDKVVVICGASSGIGEVAVYRYAAAGAKLIISARSRDKLEKVRTHALSLGAASIHLLEQDFSQVNQLEEFQARILNIHPTVDILLLNHAAMPLGPWSSFPAQQSTAFTLRTFNVNVLSFIELTRLFLPHLETTSGQILATSSMSGSCPYGDAGLYTATKHALNGFFYSLQQELLAKESNVTVTVFSLGLIMTQEMGAVLSSEPGQYVPGIIKGSVEKCGDIILSSAVTRPRNVDYPKLLVKVTRFLANYFPYYNELMNSLTGRPYNDVVEVYVRINKLSKELRYQVGNRP